jgi:hypothetical protein
MSRVQRVSGLLLVSGALLVWPAGAGAVDGTVTISPTSLTFAPQAAGTTSAAQQVTLTKDCSGANQTNCLGPPADGTTFNTSISVPAPFKQTNTCPNALTASPLPDPGTKVSCTISVTFAPTAAGAASGTLTTGAGAQTGAAGPTVSLTGTGTAASSAKKCKGKKGKAAKKKKCKRKKKKK